eukprot:scaffold935_cov248-Pinguiococcus_pyrenoidosus.AAC.21
MAVQSFQGKYDPSDYDPDLRCDPDQGYKASYIKIWSCGMPHMRSFHFAWLSFFMAFLGWFAFAPLIPEIRKDLDLTDNQIWTANITSVGSTIVARFMVGPMCDRFGPKIIQVCLLCIGAFFTYLAPVITDATGLIIIRLFIGIVGSTFVCTQYWSAMLFTKETAGAAQAISGGWGNLGGGVTQIFMAGIYSGIRAGGNSRAASWRLAMIVPASLLLCTAVGMYLLSEDSPKGDYKELIKSGHKKKVDMADSARKGFAESATWVLFAQYAGCFGVELTVNNSLTSYFVDKFDLPLVTASAIASSFGGMNLFARAIGGFLSDGASKRMGMRGRLIVQFACLFAEGVLLVIFASMDVLAPAIIFLVLFSLSVQASEGATFGIVPYVYPPATGAVAGVVGAGGNVGAVSWGFIFLFGGMSASQSFQTVGYIVIALSFLTVFVFLRGDHEGLIWNPIRNTADFSAHEDDEKARPAEKDPLSAKKAAAAIDA